MRLRRELEQAGVNSAAAGQRAAGPPPTIKSEFSGAAPSIGTGNGAFFGLVILNGL